MSYVQSKVFKSCLSITFQFFLKLLNNKPTYSSGCKSEYLLVVHNAPLGHSLVTMLQIQRLN